jgi:hypothetical protein
MNQGTTEVVVSTDKLGTLEKPRKGERADG